MTCHGFGRCCAASLSMQLVLILVSSQTTLPARVSHSWKYSCCRSTEHRPACRKWDFSKGLGSREMVETSQTEGAAACNLSPLDLTLKAMRGRASASDSSTPFPTPTCRSQSPCWGSWRQQGWHLEPQGWRRFQQSSRTWCRSSWTACWCPGGRGAMLPQLPRQRPKP